jgi:hypothetical protein
MPAILPLMTSCDKTRGNTLLAGLNLEKSSPLASKVSGSFLMSRLIFFSSALEGLFTSHPFPIAITLVPRRARDETGPDCSSKMR